MDTNDPVAYAIKYVEDLLSFYGLNTVVDGSMDEDVIQLSVPSSSLNGPLIGSGAENLRAMQNIVSTALKSQGFEQNRVNLDIADYKKQRTEKMQERALEWINQVKESDEELALEPMNPADRRAVHQVASDHGLETESVGQGMDRHIVLKPGK